MVHTQKVFHQGVLGAREQAHQLGRQVRAPGGRAPEQRVGGGRGPSQHLGLGEPVPYPRHVHRGEGAHRDVDRRAPRLIELGLEGDREPYGPVGVDGEPFHEVRGQRRVLGEVGQVRPPGDASFGAGAVQEPMAQRLGGGLRIAQERGGDVCVPSALPQCGGPPHLGLGVGEQRRPLVRRQLPPRARSASARRRIAVRGQVRRWS
ncbi:hypothetical protein [Streptomyces yangpuensis]|uniref:hypothetical protein n=1 Tax=Streptomyces yangpuensis TaxID=1648182 RepID=UPI00382EF3B6